MNAIWIKSTTSTGQANAYTKDDATLADDPSQTDGTLHSGGPDGTRCVLWNLGTPTVIQNLQNFYHGALGGCNADFSNDGVTFSGGVGTFGVPATGPGVALSATEDGNFGTWQYIRFLALSPAAGRAIDETQVNVGGSLVGPPADTTAPAPLSASIGTTGTGGTLTWTERSGPVLQAAGHGTNQGLALTSSAGLVVLSAVSTTGTTTSFTTSRIVGPTEALTLAGDAGSFTDSATAHNATAAFSGLAVTNGSTAVTPAAPVNLAGAASYGPVAVVWSWQAPPTGPTPDTYRLYTGQYPGSETIRQSGIAGLTFTDTSIVKGRPTSAYVSAVKSGVEGPASTRAILTVLDQPTPCLNCPPVF